MTQTASVTDVGPLPSTPSALSGRGEALVVALGAIDDAVCRVWRRQLGVGATVFFHDLAEDGLSTLSDRLVAVDARVLCLPALIGRWPAKLRLSGSAGLRAVVLVGSELDDRSAAGVRAALSPTTELIAWPGPERGPLVLWEVEQQLRDSPGVATAFVWSDPRSPAPTCVIELSDASAGTSGDMDLPSFGHGPVGLDVTIVAEGVVADVAAAPEEVGPAHSNGTRHSSLGPWRPVGTDAGRAVAGALEAVCGVAPVGADDLLADLVDGPQAAAWVVDDLASRCDVRLRPGELIGISTVGGLAASIAEDDGRRRSTAIRLAGRPSTQGLAGRPSEKPPLFLVHDVGGSAFPLRSVAEELAGHEVQGFESPLWGGEPCPFRSLELMALRYLVDVRRLQADGPYRLAGWGFGGIVAFEMACRLVADGAPVTAVGVVDAGPGTISHHAGGGSSPVDRLRRVLASLPGRTPSGRVPPPLRFEHAKDAHLRLLESYHWRSTPVAVPLTLFWSRDVGSVDATMGWADVIDGDVDIVRLPTDGDALPGDVTLRGWGEALRVWLERTEPS